MNHHFGLNVRESAMTRRSRMISVSAALIATAVVVVVIVMLHEGVAPLHIHVFASSELLLPSAAPQGNWGDPKEGARWEEERRNIGIELLRRKEIGPVRCSLRVRPVRPRGGSLNWKLC